MNRTQHNLQLSRILVLSSLVLASMNLYVISAVAGPSAASILDAGEVVRKIIYGAAGGAGTAVGTAAANQIINSNKPYVVFWQVRGNDGLLYNVCQNMQNGRPISQPYWCP